MKITINNKRIRRIKIKNQKKGILRNSSKNRYYKAVAPSTFSIVNNSEETIHYFNMIIKQMSRKEFKKHFYFDLSRVTNLTIDAIMYTIAILRNIKSFALYKYQFSGNQPTNEETRKAFKESGFLRYVNSSEKNLIQSSSKIQIISGNTVDTEVAGLICDFVNEKCKTKLKFTFSLYDSLIELMTNTIQHAYKGKDILIVNSWYVFVENEENKIKIIFLDTGEGIPNTINKKLTEKIPLFTKDSELIRSALKGENRSETRSKNRGKGLPAISDYCIKGIFENLQIYSGGGSCMISESLNKNYILKEVDEKIFGTLFSWEINKNTIGEEYKI